MIHVFCNLEEDDEDGRLPFCDMTFEIVESAFDERRNEWTLAFQADAEPLGTVGFGAIVPTTGWNEQIDVDDDGGDAFHSYWGAVQLSSRGAESDTLLALLADYFDIEPPADGLAFVSEIDCLAVGIQSDPAQLADDVVRMKLFFDEGVESGRYAEVFLNIDLPQGFVALNEKDEDYRVDLVHWLSLKGPVDANPHPELRRAA